ncbi:DinB family protein, partial [Nocardioides sp.]|uniref:DinB family protein n=1 Tax=Nocardioides sp. TaxID=35761 RepID=UPI002732A786
RLVRENAHGRQEVMGGAAPATLKRRPRVDRWSVLEYACHVRDVHRIFEERLALMLGQDDPLFANWDQDETAVTDRYAEQDPAVVLPDLVAAAESVAAAYDGVTGDQWARPGRRSNGSVFTVESMGRYHLHDVVHHLVDVVGPR